MINLLTDRLPDSIAIRGQAYSINPDFRLMVRLDILLSLFQDEAETDERAAALLSLFREFLPELEQLIITVSVAEIVKAVMNFYACSDGRSENGSNESEEQQEKYHSFLYDSTYIYAAFMQAYRIDLTRARLHWFQFRALLLALPQDCLFSRIVDYRSTDLADVPEGKRDFYRKMKRRYALPLPQAEQEKNDAIAEALMNGGDLTGVL